MIKKFNLFAIFAILLMMASSCNPEDYSYTVTDIDGNVYNTVKIGTQVWLVENLKTTKYCNGDSIGTTTPATKDIFDEIAPKYQWAYNGNEENVSKYGRLYTWSVVSDSRKIAPTGWHVPTDAEWTILENYLIKNGYNYDGTTTENKIAKSLAATTDWKIDPAPGTIGNNLKKNNTSGFTALPGGYRDPFGSFNNLSIDGNWWSSTQIVSYNYWYRWSRSMGYGISNVYRNEINGEHAISIRCIRDY